MSLPDGWRELEREEVDRLPPPTQAFIAAWEGPRQGDSVVVNADGTVESGRDFPVELLPHLQSAWVNHQKTRAP